MISTLINKFIEKNGIRAFLIKLNELELYLNYLKKRIILILLLSIIIFVASVFYMLFDTGGIDKILYSHVKKITDAFFLINLFIFIISSGTLLINIRKIIKINIAITLIRSFEHELLVRKDTNSEELLIIINKWIRKISLELSIPRIIFSKIVTSKNLSNKVFQNKYKSFML